MVWFDWFSFAFGSSLINCYLGFFCIFQGVCRSWKVPEFSMTVFQASKVMENKIGHGESWEMIVKTDQLWLMSRIREEEEDCKDLEFLELFTQIINCNLKPTVHYALK